MSFTTTKKKEKTVAGRYREVIRILMKYGFEDLVAHPPFNRLIPKSDRLVPHREGKSVFEFSRYERMRMVCEELGTTFIKFAQIASNRPDLLPEELISEVTKFQDQVKRQPWDEIRSVLIEEFGRKPEDIFWRIDRTPIATGSIAQVHKAKLKDGRDVVLKIQRPQIREEVKNDILILKRISALLEEKFESTHAYQPRELVRMFEKSIRKEMHFANEAANMKHFKELFKWDQRIYVPEFYPEYSTDRIICMEYINGLKITDLEGIKKLGLNGPKIAEIGINLYFKQIFDFGFFHADPHPGNFLVLANGKICFLDFGMMGNVVDSDKELLGDLLLAVHDRDLNYLKNSLEKFSKEGRIENAKDLEYDIMEFFNEYSNMNIGQVDGNEVIKGLNSLFFDYKIRIPSNLLLLLKALVIVEGVGLQVDPNYNVLGNIEYYVQKLLLKKYSVHKLKTGLVRAVGDFKNLAFNLPTDLEQIIHKLREGKLHLEFEHRGLEELYRKMEIVSNRLSFTLVLTALILGSSIMVVAKTPPYIYNISAFGFIGFVLSAFFALRLMISILKHGKF